MKVILIVLFLNSTTTILCQTEKNAKAEISKYYVELYRIKILSNYEHRINNHKADLSLTNFSDPNLISELYLSKKYPATLLGYEIYLIYNMTSTHTEPYIIGINNDYKLLKIGGFTEEAHIIGDTSSFINYDDSLSVNELNINSLSNSEIINLITTIAKLKTYFSSPYNLEVKEIKYEILNNKIFSNFITIETVADYNGKENIIKNKFEIIIPKNGIIEILSK